MAKGTNVAIAPGPLASTSVVLEDGKFSTVPVREEDIGAELLPILSKGLYTDPLHSLREYVQNSGDAGATQVTIKITGNSVVVHDNGRGMNQAELIDARRFGVSGKDMLENVGFRGIGIYSGFDLCNRLLITTKQAGDTHSYVMEFDFGKMKTQLIADSKAGAQRTPLIKLLEAHSRFSQEPAAKAAHATTVQLEDISDFHIAQLRDRKRLKAYILRNLPIDFDERFEHRDAIVTRLKDEVPGYKAIKVILESDTEPREVVTRPAIPRLDAPIMSAIKNEAGDTIAFYWACLHKAGDDGKRGKIPEAFAYYRGFVYKVKGFTIGNNTKLQGIFKTGGAALYQWYTGEIYVTDPAVIPNTERDDFETNRAYESLQSHVRETLKDLQKKASKYQSEERALELYKKHEARVTEIARGIRAGSVPRVEAFSELDNIFEELTQQRGSLPTAKKDWAKAVLKTVDDLRTNVRKKIEDQPKEKGKKAGRSRAGETETKDDAEGGGKDEGNKQWEPVAIAQLIDDAGVLLEEDALRVLRIVDEALAGVLLDGSETHQAVLAEIAEGLAAEFAS
jgi:molecular chaperone HtpG